MEPDITKKLDTSAKKSKYIRPDIDVVEFDYSNVITTSGCDQFCFPVTCVDCKLLNFIE